jgi:hypothetical protein
VPCFEKSKYAINLPTYYFGYWHVMLELQL